MNSTKLARFRKFNSHLFNYLTVQQTGGITVGFGNGVYHAFYTAKADTLIHQVSIVIANQSPAQHCDIDSNIVGRSFINNGLLALYLINPDNTVTAGTQPINVFITAQPILTVVTDRTTLSTHNQVIQPLPAVNIHSTAGNNTLFSMWVADFIHNYNKPFYVPSGYKAGYIMPGSHDFTGLQFVTYTITGRYKDND